MYIQCPICLDDFEGSADMSKIQCGHHFHDKCIRDWMLSPYSNRTCPCCREHVKTITTVSTTLKWQLTEHCPDTMDLRSIAPIALLLYVAIVLRFLMLCSSLYTNYISVISEKVVEIIMIVMTVSVIVVITHPKQSAAFIFI